MLTLDRHSAKTGTFLNSIGHNYIETSDLSKGIYILQILSLESEDVFVKKLIIL